MKIKVKITDLSKEEIVDLLSTALYGSPWWEVDNSTEEYNQAKGDTIEEKLADMLLKDQSVYLIDMEEDTPYEFGKDASDYRLLKDEIIQDDIGTPKESVGKKR